MQILFSEKESQRECKSQQKKKTEDKVMLCRDAHKQTYMHTDGRTDRQTGLQKRSLL